MGDSAVGNAEPHARGVACLHVLEIPVACNIANVST